MKNKKAILLIMIFILVFQAAACNTKSNKEQSSDSNKKDIQQITTDDNTSKDSTTVKQTEDTDQDIEETTENTGNDSVPVKPAATKEISIYTINESTTDVEIVPALIPEDSEITPELIVELVKDSLADHMIKVGIDDVSMEGDTVIVSFLSNQPPFINVGSGLEETILDAFAQSLIDNLKGSYSKVIFRKEGKAYVSGHLEFGIDEVYLDGSSTK